MDAEINLILFLQTQEWALPFMRSVSSLGSQEFFLLFLPLLFWCWDSHLGFRVALILALGQGLNSAFKIDLHSPRPYWINPEVKALSIEPSFGMPSGHAQHAVSIWGLIAHAFRRPLAYALAFALILLIGVSRIYLGVHFPADVIAGWAMGALLLAAFIILEPSAARRLSRLDLNRQIMVSFLASLGIMAFLVAGWVALGSWQVPPAWAENAIMASDNPVDPLRPQQVNAAGLIFGIATGYAILLKRGGFLANGPAAQRLMRYILGMAGVMLIWYGLGGLIYGLPGGFAKTYLHTMLMGLWVTIGAPLLFWKLKLAEMRSGPG